MQEGNNHSFPETFHPSVCNDFNTPLSTEMGSSSSYINVFGDYDPSQESDDRNNIGNYNNNNDDQSHQQNGNQQQLFREFQLMSQNLGFEDDYDFGLNYYEIPEYDVRDKLQSLNAQLASEPLPPPTEHRNSKVAFKEDLVSLVAPPDDYDYSASELDDEENNKNVPVSVVGSDHQSEHSLPEHIHETSFTHEIDAEKNKSQHDETKTEKIFQTNDNNKMKENMVVSRSGHFQLLGTNEIMDSSNRASKNEGLKANQPKLRQNRSMSASTNKGYNKDMRNSTTTEINLRPNSQTSKQNGRIRNEIPRVDKDALRRQQERKKKQEEENLKRYEEEQNMKKDMSSKSYEAWLQIKQKQRKEDDERKRKEEEEKLEKEERKQEERKYLAQELENELFKKLEQDKKKEEKIKQYMLKEMEESMIVHSNADCEKAFNDWLKKKHQDYKNKVKEEKRNARLARLSMRQSRKSQDLIQAMQQSTSSRYLDFY